MPSIHFPGSCKRALTTSRHHLKFSKRLSAYWRFMISRVLVGIIVLFGERGYYTCCWTLWGPYVVWWRPDSRLYHARHGDEYSKDGEFRTFIPFSRFTTYTRLP